MVLSLRLSLARSQRTWRWMGNHAIKLIFSLSSDSGRDAVERITDMQHTSTREMRRMKKTIVIWTVMVSALAFPNPVDAGSLGDFFKALGSSIAHPGQKKKPAPKPQTTKSKTTGKEQTADYPPSSPPAPPPTPTPTATTTQPPI